MRSLPLLLAVAAATSCSRDNREGAKLRVAVTAITACPKGAVLEGEAFPAGTRQRCQKDESTRHGATREWYEDGRERTYSEWWEGEKHGRHTLWHRNGKLRAEGAHRFGVPAGKWTLFGEDGVLQQQRTFEVEPPPADWVAQAIAGIEPVRDVPPASQVSSETTGAGAISSPVNDGVPPAAPVKAPAVKAPDKGAAAAPAPAYTPAPVDPVFARGTQSN